MPEESFELKEDRQAWTIEDIQEKVQTKLANIFSFYNEQEFLDEIHGIEPSIDTIELDKGDQIE